MYVCICNALNTRTVTQAIDDGARTVGQVYKACGAVPQCGKCKCTIREMLDCRGSQHMAGAPGSASLPGLPADPLPSAFRAA
jgi:bacterioferritin-associated ferredoxin